ncbi:MAG: AMP-binding protein [Rhizobiaceae bacterium]|nr:AMP-binding protein [Rhizobiaceae bacterium]
MLSEVEKTSEIYLPLGQRVLGPLLADRARTEGERPYLTFSGRTLSYAQTNRDVRAIGGALRRLGVQKGDMVTLLAGNSVEFVLTWYACCVVGAVFVGVNLSYTGDMLDYVMNDSRPRGMVIDRRLIGQLATLPQETLERLDWVAVIGGTDGLELPAGPSRYFDFGDMLTGQGDDPQVDCTFGDINCVSYTSGTTGPSKGVLIPNGLAFANAVTFMRAVGLGPDDILYTPLPLFHGIASRQGALSALVAKAQVVIDEKFSARQFWRRATETGATVAHTIFTIPVILKTLPPSEWDTAHRLRVMYNAHQDPEFEARFNVRLAEAYGLTETGLTIFTPWPESRREGSSGRAHEDWEIGIVDDNDVPVADGVVGELVVRPKLPSILMQGYHNKDRETLAAFRNLWFHTGDFARRDADGYLYFAGRKKERIRRRGENISGYEVEQIIARHPEVSEVAALPYPAPAGEDDLRCVIVRAEGSTLSAEALAQWLETRMPPFMQPRYIEFTDDLPRTASAKVEKYKLIEAGLGSSVWDREGQVRPGGVAG